MNNIKMSIFLTAGIITAYWGYEHIGTSLWLILLWMFLVIAFICRNLIYSQCLALYLCLFLVGGTLASHQLDAEHEPITLLTSADLSRKDVALGRMHHLREQVEQKMRSLGIEEQDFAVVAAMALGDKDALDADTRESYSISGASHVLAVSGLHITIIFQLFVMLMGGNRRRKLPLIMSLIAIWVYVMFIGLPASGVRSATMLSIYGFLQLSERRSSPIYMLALAYLLMVIFSPLSIFCISFQMSFLAVGSILLFYPLFGKLYQPQHRVGRWAWGMLCVSASAQIGTLPLIAYYFGRVSCYSLFTSFIAIPMATAVLCLCVGILLLSPLLLLPVALPIARWLIEHIADVLVAITQASNTAFRLISMLPGASIELIHLGKLRLVLSYLFIAMLYLLWKKLERLSMYKITRNR